MKHCNVGSTVRGYVAPARTLAVSGLLPGTSYQLNVTAHNTAGATTALYAFTTAHQGIGTIHYTAATALYAFTTTHQGTGTEQKVIGTIGRPF